MGFLAPLIAAATAALATPIIGSITVGTLATWDARPSA